MFKCRLRIVVNLCVEVKSVSPHTSSCNPLENRRKRTSHLGLSPSYQVTRHCCYGRFRSPSILTPHCGLSIEHKSSSVRRRPLWWYTITQVQLSIRLSCWFNFLQPYFTQVNPNSQLFAHFWISCALRGCNDLWETLRYGLDTPNPDNWSAIIKSREEGCHECTSV